jgi:hypothetical protein
MRAATDIRGELSVMNALLSVRWEEGKSGPEGLAPNSELAID